jgi:hypothetical protein
MQKIQKIKLMMGYDLSKTLNENVKSLDIILENEVNIDEAGEATVAKDLESAIKAGTKDIAKIDANIARAGVKDIKSFKDLETALKDNKLNPSDVSLLKKNIINSLDKNSKLYNELVDNMTSKSAFYAKYKNYNQQEIAQKLESFYGQQKASDIASKFIKKEESGFFKDIEKNTTGTNPSTGAVGKDAQTDITKTEPQIKGNQMNGNTIGNGNFIVNGDFINNGTLNLSKNSTLETVEKLKADTKVDGAVKKTVEENVKETNKITRWDKFRERAGKILNKKWLYAIGAIGGGYLILKWLFGGNTHPDIPKWSPCMTDVINNGGDNVDLKATSDGDPVIAVKKSERYPELDAVGGLWFFHTGRVTSADKGLTKKGTWSCPGGKMQVAEDTTLNEDALGNIQITWDGQPTKTTTTGGGGTTKTSMYKNCTDFPFTFGCKSEKITEIQKCLGMEEKYQTGNFGPITKAKLIEKEINDGTSITQEDYNKIMASCGGSEEQQTKVNLKPGQEPTIEPTIKKVGEPTAPQTISPDIKPADIKPAENGDKGKAIFDMLKSNYNDGVNPENPYIFTEGDRLKYKGTGLDQSILDQLSNYITSLGYHFIKAKPKEDYGYKYVWEKN